VHGRRTKRRRRRQLRRLHQRRRPPDVGTEQAAARHERAVHISLRSLVVADNGRFSHVADAMRAHRADDLPMKAAQIICDGMLQPAL